jgi:hypothetical protein
MTPARPPATASCGHKLGHRGLQQRQRTAMHPPYCAALHPEGDRIRSTEATSWGVGLCRRLALVPDRTSLRPQCPQLRAFAGPPWNSELLERASVFGFSELLMTDDARTAYGVPQGTGPGPVAAPCWASEALFPCHARSQIPDPSASANTSSVQTPQLTTQHTTDAHRHRHTGPAMPPLRTDTD